MRRHLPLLAASAALLLSLAALALTATWSPLRLTSAASAPANATSYLFVQTADAGSYADNGDGTATLTLTGAAPLMTFFSDRPVRDAGTLAVEDAIDELWDPELPAPNAVLVTTPAGGDEISAPLELRDPVYDPLTETLTLTVTPIGSVTPGLAEFELTAGVDVPEAFGPAELFIDSGYNRCKVRIENPSVHDLDLHSREPSDGDRWSGGPPETLPAGHNNSFEFKFHSNSKTKDGELVYYAANTDTVEITMSFGCRYVYADVNTENYFSTEPKHESCSTNASGWVDCSAYEDDDDTIVFKVTND